MKYVDFAGIVRSEQTHNDTSLMWCFPGCAWNLEATVNENDF